MLGKKLIKYSVLLITLGIFLAACQGENSSNGESTPPGDNSDLDDANVITCRFDNLYSDGNCTDFPESEGWNTTDVDEACKAFTGTEADTVVVVTADSCLVEMGAESGAKRCKVLLDGQFYYAYAVPDTICKGMLSGVYEKGPFTEIYPSSRALGQALR